MANRRQTPQQVCQQVVSDSLLNASKDGFRNLVGGEPFVQDNSSSIVRAELEADLAARQIEHCLESWHYLSQALAAYLNGQDNIAIHMGYYSEIRSANSLFASTGIAIKGGTNYYLDSNGVRRSFDTRTHRAIREIWSTWCSRPDALEAFEQLKVHPSIVMQDLYASIGISSIPASSVLAWGYELVQFGDDHTARNAASYDTKKAYSSLEDVDNLDRGIFVGLLWDHLSSTGLPGQCRFEQIYARYLLWGICVDFAKDEDDNVDSQRYSDKFGELVGRLNANTGVEVGTLTDLLSVNEAGEDSFKLFSIASSTNSGSENVLARAFILARLALNKLNNNFAETSCVAGVAWVQDWLFKCGVTSDGQDETEVTIYSEDIHDMALSLGGISVRDMWREMSEEVISSARLDIGICWGVEF